MYLSSDSIRRYNTQRALYYGNMSYLDYVRNANNETLKIMLVEQRAGYDNIEEIVQVKGIDIIALCPGDLSLNVEFSRDMNRIEIKDMISQAVEVCKKYNMPFITFPSIEKKSIEIWINTIANMLCFAQDISSTTYVIKQLLPFYDEIVPDKKRH